jgi:hypothetical protein
MVIIFLPNWIWNMKTSKQPKYTLIAIVAKVILIISLLFIFTTNSPRFKQNTLSFYKLKSRIGALIKNY